MDVFHRNFLKQLSRREFLKICGAGMFSLGMPWGQRSMGVECLKALEGETQQPEYGRVLRSDVAIYEEASLTSTKIKTLERDLVVRITSAVMGDNEPSHNRIWYEIGDGGYVHSGGIQPVAVVLNPALRQIPEGGRLAEVTVPYSESLTVPDNLSSKSYRLYYGTTYWVHQAYEKQPGKVWYQIRDDRYGRIYYADATHFHLIEPEEISPIAMDIPNDLKRIEVFLDTQLMVAYEDEVPVFMSRVASGARFRDGNFATPTGTYFTDRKRPTRHMSDEDRAGWTSYDLPGVPWVSYLTKLGISFHGTYWHNDFGRPRSHGCVNLSNEAARWVYRWTYPFVPLEESYLEGDTGTRVDILLTAKQL